ECRSRSPGPARPSPAPRPPSAARAALGAHVLRRVLPLPQLLAEALNLEDRQYLRLGQRLLQDVRHLLRNGAALTLRARLELPVEPVGQVLDAERRHGNPPSFVQTGGCPNRGQ